MKFLTRHITRLLLVAMLSVATGCASDVLEENPGDVMEGYDTIGYMAVRLMPSDGATRAAVGDEFDAGTAGEFSLSKEAGHYAVFYTGGQETPLAISELNGMTSDQSTDDKANSSLVYATIVGRNEMKEELEKFEECYVILNTNIPISDMIALTRDELLNKTVASPFFIDSKGERYFTMSNSVYVENGLKKIDTEVDTSKIFPSYQEAMEQAWKGNAAVTAYVERLSAKFSLRFEDERLNAQNAVREFIPKDNTMILFTGLSSGEVPYYADKDPATGTPYSYKVRLTGWGMNALEQETRLFRNFRPGVPYFDNWYSTGYKRAYWSEDCHYDKEAYAWQYRKVIDNSGIPVYEGRDNILRNYSYLELNSNGFNKSYQYTPENTFDFRDPVFARELNSRPEMLAGTHIIVCAEMLTNIQNPGVWAPQDIYRDRNGSYYKNELDCVKALVSSFNNILKSHAFLKFTYWDWSKGGVEYKLFAMTRGEFGLYYDGRKLDPQYVEELYKQGVSFLAEAEFKGSDGKRILWNDKFTIQDAQGNQLQSYSNIDEVDASKNEYLRPSTVNDMKSVIFENVGAVDHFQDGKMYYAIPIGYVQNQAATPENGQAPYSVYGVVRNSTYEIVITGVSGLGTSVDIETQPIIPNTVSSQDHLFIGFEILEWHPIENTVPGVIN